MVHLLMMMMMNQVSSEVLIVQRPKCITADQRNGDASLQETQLASNTDESDINVNILVCFNNL